MRWARRPDLVTIAGLLVVWSVAWSVTPGRIAEDTKNDLYVDPWGFLGRALHLWDPQVTWGGPSNQGYGYLFPMGPFFGIGSELAPMWVVQRVWWGLLLTAGFLGMRGLLRALGVGSDGARVVGALAYVLAPRVVTSIGALSAEIQPQLLAPLVLWPVVLGSTGRLSPGRAATLSGVAALFCGGVNATATLCGLVPTGLWLLTRTRWWRSRLTWSWVAAVLAATAWWLGPLLLMSRYAPPFLDWIENARAVMQPVGMLDVVRGTTHWLGHIMTPGGAWWQAGNELATRPLLIVLTSVVAALGLGGLALRGTPHRRWLWTSLILGALLLTVTHSGALASPWVDEFQSAFDGPLAPLRNIHKVDLLVRLPLAVGVAHVVGRLAAVRSPRAVRSAGPLLAAVAVVLAAGPAFTGAIAVRGTFEGMPRHWVDAGRWLDAHGEEGQTLLLPAANFGEYRWGRTIDEPLRALTAAPYAVRDAVPLAPAGTIRLLDEVERRFQTGRSLDGGAEVLRRAGVAHLVVRNDLAPEESGQPPVAFARSSVRSTPGVDFRQGFGQTFIDASGERVFPVEIYDLGGATSSPVELWEASAVTGASGASEDLLALADAGRLHGPVVFDGDRSEELAPGSRVDTDGYRARERWFGAPRGQDLTSTLTREAAVDAPDYRPWPDDALRASATVDGVSAVTASSSIAEDLSFAGLNPAHRPFAAVDGDPGTSWAAMWDERPTLRVDLDEPTEFDHVTVTGLVDDVRLGSVAAPTRLRVSTDRGSVTATLGDGPTEVAVGAGAHAWLRIEILETDTDDPGTAITGLVDVSIPGVTPREGVRLAERPEDDPVPGAVVLGSGLAGRDGCTSMDEFPVCLGGATVAPEQNGSLRRVLDGALPGDWTGEGSLQSGAAPETSLQGSPDVSVTASSVRNASPQASPSAVVDGDDRTAWSPAFDDETPELTFTFERDVTVDVLRFQTRNDWAARAAPAVVIDIGGKQVTRRIQANGVVDIPPTTGRTLHLEFIRVAGERETATNAALELEALDLGATTFAPPRSEVTATCGQGPRLVVDGHVVPTAATVHRDDVFGAGTGSWRACAPVTFDESQEHTVEVGPWRGFSARSAVLTRTGGTTPSTDPQPVEVTTDGASLTGAVIAHDTARVLVMDQNANRGWVARVGGTELAGQVIDGRRQAFVVPAGVAGDLHVEFAPERTYRGLLLLGLALAVGLVVAAAGVALRRAPVVLAVDASPRVDASARHRQAGPWLLLAGALVGGVLVSGPLGGVVALLAGFVAQRWTRVAVGRIRGAVVAGIVVACGVAQAVVAPGSVGGAVFEGTLRLVLVAVVAFAALTSVRREPRREA